MSLPPALRPLLPWIIAGITAALVILAMSLSHWRTAAVVTLLVIAFLADTRFRKLGAEFMPELNEGSILDMPTSAPRIAMAQAIDDVMVRDRLIRSFPEVEQVVGKIGRADTATDPSPVDMVETVITLRPHQWWPKRKMEMADALEQAATVAAQMAERGFLRFPDAHGKDYEIRRALRHKGDPAVPKALADEASLVELATQIAVEKLDRAMRELARRRQVEYDPVVARELAAAAFDALIAHLRTLPPKDGRPALLREPTSEERQRILSAALPHGALLAQVPRQEEVDKLLADLRGELIDRKLAASRPSSPSACWRRSSFAARSSGSSARSFSIGSCSTMPPT
jgi:Cu(I)/Ag(I) efflux system membrane protein CusA/SilA